MERLLPWALTEGVAAVRSDRLLPPAVDLSLHAGVESYNIAGNVTGKHRRNHADHVGTMGGDFMDIGDINPANGADRNGQSRFGLAEHRHRNELREGFGGRGKKRAEGNVISPCILGHTRPCNISIARHTDDALGKDLPRLGELHVLNTNMEAIGPDALGEMGTIIDNKNGLILTAQSLQLDADFLNLTVFAGFMAILQELNPGLQGGFGLSENAVMGS